MEQSWEPFDQLSDRWGGTPKREMLSLFVVVGECHLQAKRACECIQGTGRSRFTSMSAGPIRYFSLARQLRPEYVQRVLVPNTPSPTASFADSSCNCVECGVYAGGLNEDTSVMRCCSG